MKILIVGGYGTFGGRLCQLLAADKRIMLLIAGRSIQRAESMCQQLPAGAQRQPIVFDRDDNISQQLKQYLPDLLIDATGPFQAYGQDPYRVLRGCLENNVNYMDLADGAAFVAGVSQFDEVARQRNLYLISGVSTCPALTAAAVRKLAIGMHHIISIKGGIAPSPYAGVGLNVIRAIAGYAGKKCVLWRNGKPADGGALTEIMRYTICPPGYLPLNNRRFSLVEVPDLQLLANCWPGVDSVWIGAAPEPELLHRALNAMAWLVRWHILPSLRPFATVFFHAINTFRWGEHRGGMFVELQGINNAGNPVTRSWHLLAERDSGPLIPCMGLQALILRSLAGHPPDAGARTAINELEVKDYVPLFKQHAIVTGEREMMSELPRRSIFETLLGHAWQHLPVQLQRFHRGDAVLRANGSATVERGKGWLARLVATWFGLPQTGQNVPVSVTMHSRVQSESWQRTFAGQSFSTILSAGTGRSDALLCEQFGPFTFGLALVMNEDKLYFITRNWRLLGIPLPMAIAPVSDIYEFVHDGKFCFNIEIKHFLMGRIVKYMGWLVPTV